MTIPANPAHANFGRKSMSVRAIFLSLVITTCAISAVAQQPKPRLLNFDKDSLNCADFDKHPGPNNDTIYVTNKTTFITAEHGTAKFQLSKGGAITVRDAPLHEYLTLKCR
jgi:hypothetical protein